MHRVVPLIFDDSFDWSKCLRCMVEQELLVFLNSSVNELSDDVAEKSCIGLTELLDVKLIAVEGLDFLIVFLGHHLTKLM